MKKSLKLALALCAAAGSLAVSSVPAVAGEGHWSIGKGVQCRVILGIVVCSSNRP